MKNGKRLLCSIAARGGSKGVPGKNLRPFLGKPLIAWTIESALGSRCLDEVMVTTDSPEIAEVAKRHGASVPFLRPAELATDTAPPAYSFAHALRYYQDQGVQFDYLVVLQTTTPLRISEDIDGAIDFLFEKQADAVIAVCEMEHTPYWSNTLPEDRSMAHFVRETAKFKQRQELPPYYRINGAVYIARVDRFLEGTTVFLDDNIYAYIMPRERSVDIDSELDLRFAEFLAQRQQSE